MYHRSSQTCSINQPVVRSCSSLGGKPQQRPSSAEVLRQSCKWASLHLPRVIQTAGLQINELHAILEGGLLTPPESEMALTYAQMLIRKLQCIVRRQQNIIAQGGMQGVQGEQGKQNFLREFPVPSAMCSADCFTPGTLLHTVSCRRGTCPLGTNLLPFFFRTAL